MRKRKYKKLKGTDGLTLAFLWQLKNLCMQELLTLLRAGYGYSVLPEMNFMNQEICFITLVGMTPLSYGIFYKIGSRNPLLKEFVSVLKESTKE